MTKRTSDDVYHQLRARGWAPALWAHHPPEVKEVFHRQGWLPLVKQCFANCQRFVLHAGLDVEYREGYVLTVIPMVHAWLIYKGEVLDLTLDPNREIQYLASYTVFYDEILSHVIETERYGPVHPHDLDELSPFYEGFLKLQKLAKKK